MPSTLGPLFALKASAPKEWNVAHGEDECVLLVENHRAISVNLLDVQFRERLETEETWVFIAQILREDAETLFAFATVAERTLFLELRNLDSVGPKLAQLIIAGLGRRGLMSLLQGVDPKSMPKVTGLGPKTLEKLAAGLKGKRDTFLLLLSSGVEGALSHGPHHAQAHAHASKLSPLVFTSLEKLGLRPFEVERLFDELLTLNPEAAKADPGTQLKLLLQQHGRSRSRIVSESP